ncbi:tyrosinase tyrosinase: common central domain protein [Rhizoctonia solani AG-3 Rhs1AP]|uniref:Tyrosinase tyrosinase: common central domain protein n=1 Tax=Rhizoctonia solani AG-3 Rhs1AP TaxID=1086054 RepID=X8J9M9_9AGAM|nr:tyrosinase tyrosinase: common central domain protein [Rhizoctonia solani AG-3 Rhs1AP]
MGLAEPINSARSQAKAASAWALLSTSIQHSTNSHTITKGVGKCTNPAIRREWRTLSQDQRDSFHSAVKCLQTKPSALNVPESQTLYDDFSYVHYTINVTIHHVSSFFPWHRYFLVLHEAAMAECGYSDPIPYWDWTRDSTVETFKSSEMFDTKKGFGGDGTGKTNWTDGLCVEDGPYAGLHVNFPEPHCLTRQFNLSEQVMTNWTKSVVDEIMEYTEYLDFWNNTERHPHDNIHRTISGDLKRQYSSNEPLFYLHHAQIDRLWTIWQGRNETRLHDYAGNTIQNMNANIASQSDQLFTLNFAPTRDVASVMDTMANGLCYTYDDAGD